jgi:hypothetical protein
VKGGNLFSTLNYPKEYAAKYNVELAAAIDHCKNERVVA